MTACCLTRCVCATSESQHERPLLFAPPCSLPPSPSLRPHSRHCPRSHPPLCRLLIANTNKREHEWFLFMFVFVHVRIGLFTLDLTLPSCYHPRPRPRSPYPPVPFAPTRAVHPFTPSAPARANLPIRFAPTRIIPRIYALRTHSLRTTRAWHHSHLHRPTCVRCPLPFAPSASPHHPLQRPTCSRHPHPFALCPLTTLVLPSRANTNISACCVRVRVCMRVRRSRSRPCHTPLLAWHSGPWVYPRHQKHGLLSQARAGTSLLVPCHPLCTLPTCHTLSCGTRLFAHHLLIRTLNSDSVLKYD